MSSLDPEAGPSQQEDVLLSGPPQNIQNLQLRRQSVKVFRERRKGLKGPLRAVRLCILSIFVPGLLVAVPLYLRFHVYGEQLYPVAMTDMRMLDNKVSTTWCQRQLVRANTTFNAFLMPDQPVVEPEPVRVSMMRHLELEQDMKEYWGFYLLQGSSVTVTSCVRWPGGSLVVIHGHKHLHQCAYIGDESSEELQELEMQLAERGIKSSNITDNGMGSNEKKRPPRMRRVHPGIKFHGNQKPLSSDEQLPLKYGTEADDYDKLVLELLRNVEHEKAKGRARNVSRRVSESVVELTTESSKNDSSSEVFERVLRQLQKMGDGGKSVLRKLNNQIGESVPSADVENTTANLTAFRSLIQEMMQDDLNFTRWKRAITLSSPSLQESLNADDDEKDAALEEGFQPDGIADHHETVNETNLHDMSKSEYWSSFSSSEERLMNCEGLILNLPLTPHSKCQRHHSHEDYTIAAEMNSLTYRIPRNGYYFFVYNSENEKKSNYFRVHFDLEKRVYNVSNPMVSCKNLTGQCSLPLDFFSSEKVVLELPLRSNESLWNEEFIVVSTCEPRTALYLGCVIAVPLFILLFAFQ